MFYFSHLGVPTNTKFSMGDVLRKKTIQTKAFQVVCDHYSHTFTEELPERAAGGKDRHTYTCRHIHNLRLDTLSWNHVVLISLEHHYKEFY